MRVKQILEKMGIFAGFLLVTVFSVFLYSPTNGSNATSSTAEVSVDVGTVLSVMLASNKVEMSGMPGQTVISDPLRVYAFTNNTHGMEVILNDADDDVYMRNAETGDYIRPFQSALIDKINNNELTEEELSQLNVIEITKIDYLEDNEWAVIDGMTTSVYDDGVIHLVPLQPIDSEEPTSLGETLIYSLKANSQYEPGEYNTLELADGHMVGAIKLSDYVKIDENHNAYNDIRFVVKIGNNLTSGTYSDVVIVTAYARDWSVSG